jgi:hypothetical protein
MRSLFCCQYQYAAEIRNGPDQGTARKAHQVIYGQQTSGSRGLWDEWGEQARGNQSWCKGPKIGINILTSIKCRVMYGSANLIEGRASHAGKAY